MYKTKSHLVQLLTYDVHIAKQFWCEYGYG